MRARFRQIFEAVDRCVHDFAESSTQLADACTISPNLRRSWQMRARFRRIFEAVGTCVHDLNAFVNRVQSFRVAHSEYYGSTRIRKAGAVTAPMPPACLRNERKLSCEWG